MTDMNFEEANKTVHPVESQWHYKMMIAAGFVAKTPTGVGFVRTYEYQHPSGVTVKCTTGACADYWFSSTGPFGYWAELEPYLKKLNSST